jgi:mRNA-degrading endonuclease toxin of MazEF toxin-antitoxin module
MIQPGEIYLADFDEMKPHPVVVISREELNRGNWVAAVLITSKRFEQRSKQSHCVPFRAGELGLSKDCVAQGESLFSILDRGGPRSGWRHPAPAQNLVSR